MENQFRDGVEEELKDSESIKEEIEKLKKLRVEYKLESQDIKLERLTRLSTLGGIFTSYFVEAFILVMLNIYQSGGNELDIGYTETFVACLLFEVFRLGIIKSNSQNEGLFALNEKLEELHLADIATEDDIEKYSKELEVLNDNNHNNEKIKK